MDYIKENKEENRVISPLNLLFKAYSDQHPAANQVVTESYRALEQHLATLSEEDQDAVFQIVYSIYTEKERLAFLAGLQTGVRLQKELSE